MFTLGRLSILLNFFLVLVAAFTSLSFASVGAGGGIGQIIVREKLAPGGVYRLPAWPVLNTGDTEATFLLKVDGVDSSWFQFSQNNFKMRPGESKMITTHIALPFVAAQGTYNVYLENQVIPSGPVGIGPAAATKLRFTVGEGSGVLGAATQRAYTWFELNRRLALFLFLLLDLVILYFIIRKFFKISFKVESKK